MDIYLLELLALCSRFESMRRLSNLISTLLSKQGIMNKFSIQAVLKCEFVRTESIPSGSVFILIALLFKKKIARKKSKALAQGFPEQNY